MQTARVGNGELPLITWLTERLPADFTMIGWRLADDLVPALVGAAKEATPVGGPFAYGDHHATL